MKAYHTLVLTVSITLIFFSSCCLGDKVGEYEYRITNNSDAPITVDVSASELNTLTFETVFNIDMGETMTILTTEGPIVSACEDIEYTDDRIDTDLETLTVINQDSLISSRDYLDGDEWSFDEGVYTITVEQDEF